MKKIKIGNLEMSEIIYGMWRISEANLETTELISLLEEMLELGINTIDTAEIYGADYNDAESKLGAAFKERPDLIEKFIIVTKNGIVARDRAKTPHYDNSFDYVINGARKSIETMNIKKIDLLLLHRPDVFSDFDEIARAMQFLKEQNLVDNFGVSNYTPIQFDALNKFLKKRNLSIVTNQIEINTFNEEHYENDNVYYLKGEEISPMIWSPMGGGELFKENNTNKVVSKIAEKYNATVDEIAIAFLHNQGLNPVTILGSNKVDRYKKAINALNIKITYEEMYEIMKCMIGRDIK